MEKYYHLPVQFMTISNGGVLAPDEHVRLQKAQYYFRVALLTPHGQSQWGA